MKSACAALLGAASVSTSLAGEPGPAAPLVADTVFSSLQRQQSLMQAMLGPSTIVVGDAGRVAIAARQPGGTVIGAGSGAMSGQFFGLAATGLAPLPVAGGTPFNAPYFALVKDGRHAGISFPLGEGRRLRIGLVREAFGQADALSTVTPFARRALVSLELEQRMGPAVAIFSLGGLRENGSLLGSLQSSSLSLNNSTRTTFAALSGGVALSSEVSLVAMAAAGRSAGFMNADSLLTRVEPVTTVSYSAGLSARRLFASDDRFGLTLTVPTKVTGGPLGAVNAFTQREDGTLAFASRTLNLRPTATERDLEMSYTRALDAGKLSGALMLRTHPGHDAAMPNDWLLGVRYSRGF